MLQELAALAGIFSLIVLIIVEWPRIMERIGIIRMRMSRVEAHHQQSVQDSTKSNIGEGNTIFSCSHCGSENLERIHTPFSFIKSLTLVAVAAVGIIFGGLILIAGFANSSISNIILGLVLITTGIVSCQILTTYIPTLKPRKCYDCGYRWP